MKSPHLLGGIPFQLKVRVESLAFQTQTEVMAPMKRFDPDFEGTV